MPTMAALDIAKQAKTGLIGYTFAIAIALFLGVTSASLMWAAGKAIGAKIQEQSPALKERYSRGLYFGAVIWIVVVALVAQRVLSLALHVAV